MFPDLVRQVVRQLRGYTCPSPRFPFGNGRSEEEVLEEIAKKFQAED